MKFTDAAKTCVIIATGPSASRADADMCAAYPCIAVNDAWQLAPHAGWLYAADYEWWQLYLPRIKAAGFAGQLWTHAPRKHYGDVLPDKLLRCADSEKGDGLSERAGAIRYGRSSGHQAISLAYVWGARRIILLGFDCCARGGRSHFFGEHPVGLRRETVFGYWEAALVTLSKDLRARSVEVLNCSPGTILRCFPQAALADALNTKVAA